MTIREIRSRRKKKSIYYQVKHGEKSAAEALEEVENLYDAGKLIEADYNEIAEYLEEILDREVETEETVEETEDNSWDETEENINRF